MRSRCAWPSSCVSSFEHWRDEVGRQRPSAADGRLDRGPRFYFIDVSLQAIPTRRNATTLRTFRPRSTLDHATVDRLRAVARKLLLDSPDFKQLVEDLGN